MSNTIRTLQPTALWNHFADLNAVPRASKKEERVIQFMMNFGNSLGLNTIRDHIGNVIIKKDASPGMEERQTVVLQSHLDMVHQKNSDVDFNFDTQGIAMVISGDWVNALGTTLGADNGIGVASIMALLASKNIAHPAIEALFTIDEETGMTGALELKGGMLSGNILLNLDTEDDDELTIGCAGGIDITATANYSENDLPENFKSYEISVRALKGGHSGMDIHLGRGNANKLMNRLLLNLTQDLGLAIHEINGGGLRNAIPRESFAKVAVQEDKIDDLLQMVEHYLDIVKKEYRTTDPELSISIRSIDSLSKIVETKFQLKMLQSLYVCPNGIYRMSPEIEGLVQSSNNLAKVTVKDGQFECLCLTRSAVDSEKLDLAEAIKSGFSLLGAKVSLSGSYPGWTPKPTAPIIKIMADIYRNRFNEAPNVNACHAGLECGILGTNYPNMDMISFGPNIRGAHSPDERVQISSVQKFWGYLLEVLQNIPAKTEV